MWTLDALESLPPSGPFLTGRTDFPDDPTGSFQPNDSVQMAVSARTCSHRTSRKLDGILGKYFERSML